MVSDLGQVYFSTRTSVNRKLEAMQQKGIKHTLTSPFWIARTKHHDEFKLFEGVI